MRVVTGVLVSILYVALVAGVSLSEPPEGAFYKRNFARTPFDSDPDDSEQDRKKRVWPSENGDRENSRLTDGDLKQTKDGFSSPAAGEPEPTATPTIGGEQVLSLGLLVNCADTKHCLDVLGEYHTVLKDRGLKQGDLYLVGRPEEKVYQSAEWQNLRNLNISYRKRRTVPKRYSVTRSPSWVVELSGGEVLLQGVRPVGHYISREGEFLEKLLDVKGEEG